MTPVVLRFLEQAGRTPDAPAATDDHGTRLTYDTLSRRARGLAAGLQARLGTEPGQLVSVAAKNHAEHLIALMGIFLSGHTWLPLNPRSARAAHARCAVHGAHCAVRGPRCAVRSARCAARGA